MAEDMRAHELVCARCTERFELAMETVRGGNTRPRLSLYCPKCIEELGGVAAGSDTAEH